MAVWGKRSPIFWSKVSGPQVQEEELCFVFVKFEVSGNYPRRVGRKVWLFVESLKHR